MLQLARDSPTPCPRVLLVGSYRDTRPMRGPGAESSQTRAVLSLLCCAVPSDHPEYALQGCFVLVAPGMGAIGPAGQRVHLQSKQTQVAVRKQACHLLYYRRQMSSEPRATAQSPTRFGARSIAAEGCLPAVRLAQTHQELNRESLSPLRFPRGVSGASQRCQRASGPGASVVWDSATASSPGTGSTSGSSYGPEGLTGQNLPREGFVALLGVTAR